MAALLPLTSAAGSTKPKNAFHVRTITAGLKMQNIADIDQAEAAVAFLNEARNTIAAEGHQVQTLRLATQPLQRYLPDWMNPDAIEAIQVLDQFAVEKDVSFSIGPVITGDLYHEEFARWAVELIKSTSNISFTVSIASPDLGIHPQSLRSAAEAMLAIANGTPGGEGNFRFAANAFTPPGTPFFPCLLYTSDAADED